jgi:transcriptional regulator with XRE-family HTH domain
MDERKVLGKNLKRGRSSKGLSQKELGIKVGLRGETISNIELAKQGNIGLKYLILICREPGTDISSIRGGQLFFLIGK